VFFSLAVSLFVLSLLVFVHELGHFLVAKRVGIEVEEFGLGIPPRMVGKKIGQTIYSLNWIPFGGFVKIYGMEETKDQRPKTKDRKSFLAKSKKVRAAVLLAGIFMNFFLGVLAFSLIYSFLGIPKKQGFVKVVGVSKSSPAEKAGIKEGDIIIKLKAQSSKLKANKEFVEIINENLGKEIELELDRQGVILAVLVVPREKPAEGEGPLGVVIADAEIVQPVFWQRPFLSLWWGMKEAVGWATMVFFGVCQMIYELGFKGIVPKDITGPVGIVQIASGVARAGIFAFLQFIGALSVNLSVLNFLPIPALDGGRLLFLGIEVITGRKPRPKFEKWVHLAGMIILLLLMMMITFRDVQRLLFGRS